MSNEKGHLSSHKVIQSTDISLTILNRIYEMDGGTISELANDLGIAKSTVHNHLKTLSRHRFVIKEGNTYYIGLRFREFSEYAKSRKPYYDPIKKQIIDLAEETGTEADFSIEEHGRAVPVFRKVNYEYNTSFEGQDVFYMHSSAVGKAMLSHLPDKRVNQVIQRWGLPRKTNNSITSERKLREELAEIRNTGFAINNEESKEGLRAIGTAITYPNGSVCGAISISGPTYWFTDEILNQVKSVLKSYSDEIEALVEDHYS